MHIKLLKCSVPKRYIIVFMIFMAYSNMTILHTNLSMAVVDMTTIKNTSSQDNSYELKPEFDWTAEQKGLILSSYSYGRLFSPIGGILAHKLGGSTICSIGNLVMAIITFLTPVIVSVDFGFFFIMYVVFGAFESLILPGVCELIARWTPDNERSRFVSFCEVGFFFGSVASFAVSGLVLQNYRWQVLFYCSGLVSFIWFWIWLFVVRNDPSEDHRMSKSERNYINENREFQQNEGEKTYPWRQILSFMPLWVGSLAEFAIIGGYTFTSVNLPQYIKDTANSNLAQIGFISTIPQICALISMPASGLFADYIRSLGKTSKTNLHKIFASVSLFSSAIFYAIVVISPNFIVDIVAISLFQFFSTLGLVDITVLFLDISPTYTAILMSIVNTFAISSGFVIPSAIEFIVTSSSHSQWNICFILFSGMYFCVGLLYLKFVSAKPPSWAKTESAADQNNQMK